MSERGPAFLPSGEILLPDGTVLEAPAPGTEAHRLAHHPVWGYPPAEPEPDPREVAPMARFELDLSEVDRDEAARYLRQTAVRASSAASNPNHRTVVSAIEELAESVARGGGRVELDGRQLTKPSRETLHQVLEVAAARARSEYHPAMNALTRLASAVECWIYGPEGKERPQPRRREPDGMWTSAEIIGRGS